MAAGLGFKDFVTGEVLTANDVDGYLMQGVWVFADAAARTAAVTSPQEGNMSYLKDTNSTEYYSGSAWVAISGGSSGASGCSLSMSTTVIISGSTYTAITFNTEEFDTDAYHSTSTNTSRITIPAGKAGKYQVNAALMWSNVTGDLRNILIYKNGSSYQECAYIAAAADGRTHSQTSLVMDLAVGDYIEVYAYQNKGTTVGIWGNDTYAKGTNFSVALL